MRGPFRCTPECCWAVVRAWHGWSALRRLPYYGMQQPTNSAGRLSKLITQESPPTKRARVELGSSKRDLQKERGAMTGELTMKDMEVEDLRKTVAKRANVVQELAESKKDVVFFKDKVIDAMRLLKGVEKLAAAGKYDIKSSVEKDLEDRSDFFREAANGSEVFWPASGPCAGTVHFQEFPVLYMSPGPSLSPAVRYFD